MRLRFSLCVAVSIVGWAALAVAAKPVAATATQGCSAITIRSAVTRFVTAYNTGASPQLDALFARAPEFRWYSAGQPGVRVGSDAYRRDTLLSYFRDRYRHRDRLRLLSLRFNGNSNGFGNFESRFERRATDYRGGKPFHLIGKGAAICGSAEGFISAKVRVIVMSLGSPEPT